MATTTPQYRRAHINAWVDERDHQRLRELAREQDRSLSAELRRAIAAHVDREVVFTEATAGVSSGTRRSRP